MNKKFFAYSLYFVLLVSSSVSARVESVNAPNVAEGDDWVYSLTEEKAVAPGGGMVSTTRRIETTITRAGTKSFSVSVKQIDSTGLPKEILLNSDWSASKNVNGQMVVMNRPYDFPLTPGKEWKLDISANAPTPAIKVEKIIKHYAVIGWTDIKVPAGTFHALKVEMEGEWSKEFTEIGPSASAEVAKGNGNSVSLAKTTGPRTPKPVGGKLYAAFWYVPEIKSHVKSIIEDYYPGGGLHSRITEELESEHVN